MHHKVGLPTLLVLTLGTVGAVAAPGEAPAATENSTTASPAEKSHVLAEEGAARIDSALEHGDLEAAQREKELLEAVNEAPTTDKQAKDQIKHAASKVDEASAKAGCDGKSDWCGFGGGFLASYSATFGKGNRHGQTSHQIVQLFVPAIGLRRVLNQYLSLDFSAYTALVSPQFKVNSIDRTGSGCGTTDNAFEDALPCEGNAALRPYGALLAGVTVGTGSSSLGVITIGLTGGAARTTQDATAFFFWGIMVTTGGVYATVPIR